MASDKIKWYDCNTLQPILLVPNANGKGQHEPTLRDAKREGGPAYGALASTTAIPKTLGYPPGLVDYFKVSAVRACIDAPWTPCFEKEGYIKATLQKSRERDIQAAEKGTEFHTGIAIYQKRGAKPPEPILTAAVWIENWIKQTFPTLRRDTVNLERRIGSRELGYCGAPDWSGFLESGQLVVLDWKTVDLEKWTRPYDEWLVQGGSYGHALRTLRDQLPDKEDMLDKPCIFYNIAIDRATGTCIPCGPGTKFEKMYDMERWEAAWCHLFEYWCLTKGYDPRRIG